MDLKKGMNVTIHLRTLIKQNNEEEEFLYELLGQVARVGDNLYIRYQEPQENGVTYPVTLKIFPDGQVQLVRTAQTRTRFLFNQGQVTETRYQTPYGNIELGVKTKKLHFSLKDEPISGRIEVVYDLLMATETVGNYFFELVFLEESQGKLKE